MSDVTSILSQIRSYQHQMGTRALEPNPGAFVPNRVGLEQPGVKAPSFGETLQNKEAKITVPVREGCPRRLVEHFGFHHPGPN